MKMDISSFYEKNKAKLWLMIVVIPIVVLVTGSILARQIFWDSFLWRYFWGPVVADAEGAPVNGISSGYNIVNTATYGLILVVSFLGIFELIKDFDIEIDRTFIYTLIPWIMLGGSLRSLEDAALFADPLDKFMITPMIYFFLGFSALFLMLLGAYLSTKQFEQKTSRILRALVLVPVPIIYLIISNHLDPFFLSFIMIVFVALSISYLLGLKYFEFNEKYLFFTYGITFLSLSLAFNLYFIFFREGTNPLEPPIIIGLATAVTLLLLSVFWVADRIPLRIVKSNSFEVLGRPLNLLIIWTHLFDASSTYRGITVYGYIEKHVLPAYFIEMTFPSIIFVLNITLVLVVIFVLDIFLEKDFTEDDSLRVFLKFVIIVLGAAPAVRNTLRLAMGV